MICASPSSAKVGALDPKQTVLQHQSKAAFGRLRPKFDQLRFGLFDLALVGCALRRPPDRSTMLAQGLDFVLTAPLHRPRTGD